MNIFIAKLNRKTTAEDLTRLFETYGQVSSAKIIYDRMTGTSKGYGFIEMDDDEAAEKAINELNESTFQEAVIIVKKAHPREEKPAPPRRSPVLRKSGQENQDEEQPEEKNTDQPPPQISEPDQG